MPGGPMMNNPMNVVNASRLSTSIYGGRTMDGVNRFPYGDSGLGKDPYGMVSQ